MLLRNYNIQYDNWYQQIKKLVKKELFVLDLVHLPELTFDRKLI